MTTNEIEEKLACPSCKSTILACYPGEEWYCFNTDCELYGKEIPEKDLIKIKQV